MDETADLMSSLRGRIGRRLYWTGWAYVAAMSLVLGMVSVIVMDASDTRPSEPDALWLRFMLFAMKTAMLAALAPVMVKRLHDLNWSGYHAGLALGLLWIKNITDLAEITGDPANATAYEFAFATFSLLVFFGYTLALGLLRGTEGPNRYGADPLLRRKAGAVSAS